MRIKEHLHNRIEIIEIESNRKEYNMNRYTPTPAFCNFFSPVLVTLLVKHIDEKDLNWMI